jgi:hypothetical protein
VREKLRQVFWSFRRPLPRHGVHADDGILEIDEDKCGLFRVELEFCHGSSLLKMF